MLVKNRFIMCFLCRFLANIGLCAIIWFVAQINVAYAQELTQKLPSNADINNNVRPEKKSLPEVKIIGKTPNVNVLPQEEIPVGSEKINFILKKVKIEGAKIFSTAQLIDLYAKSLINTKISLKQIYEISAQITNHYRSKGYFLTIANVPPQSIKDGVVKIVVAEGYIGKVTLDKELQNNLIVRQYIEDLTNSKPISSAKLESFLLRLNDLYGYQFNGVLAPSEDENLTAVILELIKNDAKGAGSISFDNFGSRFLGAHRLSANYSTSFRPLHQTSVNALLSLPTNNLQYGSLNHSVVLAPSLTFDVAGGITNANPAFNLKPLEIESKSLFLSTKLNYQIIRQRRENLSVSLAVDGRNSSTNLLKKKLNRDHIRAARLSTDFNFADDLSGGYNAGNITLSKGMSLFGANDAGDLLLSRAEANPTFTKLEASFTHLQNLSPSFTLKTSLAGQLSSSPLYSSEEFGFGGQAFGRAYDNSEITGDHGLAGSLEVSYNDWQWQRGSITPYAFYDLGTVWNIDKAQDGRISGSSAGVGTKFTAANEVQLDVGLAFPLNKNISTPIYGAAPTAPRIYFQLLKTF
jgi:hemolysin activation/secretion protein